MQPVIDDERGCIECDEFGAEGGAAATVVLVPGSCSTGAAWRPVMAAWNGQLRCITTSLLGYGRTAERRTVHDTSISHECEILETVLRRAGGRPHLVGHSFGGLAALVVALRKQVALASVSIIEAPAAELLRNCGEHQHYAAFRRMTDAYFGAFERGDKEAIASMIDFYGGPGTFASWPPRVRAYAVETTVVNIRDWASAYGFALHAAALAAIDIPVLVVRGSASHAAVQQGNALIAEATNGTLATVDGAAHFMIATHAADVAHLVQRHVLRAEAAI